MLTNFRYLIADPGNFQLGRNPFSGVFEESNVKKWLSLSNFENENKYSDFDEDEITEIEKKQQR